MNITKETISKLYTLYEELDALQEKTTTLINAAKQNKNNRILIKRANGEEQEVTEEMLWTEVYHIAEKSEGFEALKRRYPEAFAASDEVTKKFQEIQKFTDVELGIDARQIKLSDIIKLVEATVDYKLNPHGN